jgi:3',5'-cyclic AMP phosphodiesterase CpdA
LLAVPILFHGLGDYSVVNGDEAIYHYMARRMLETGDWFRLEYAAGEQRLYDSFMNAPLHYWAKALVLLAFGDGNWSMRILSACFGWLSLLVTYRLSQRIAGRGAGLLAALVQLTTFQFVYLHSARTGEMEAILACLFGATAYLLLRALQENRSFVPHHLCLLLLLNLKAPIVALPLLAELSFFALEPAARRRAREWGLTLAALLPLGLAWHVYQALTHWQPFLEIARTMFGQAAGSRVPGAGLLGNAAFYAETLLFGAFPFALFYPIAFGAALARRREAPESSALRLLALYPLAIFAFYLLVAKRQPWYVVPAYPFLSALTGIWLAGLFREAPRAAGVAATALALALVACIRVSILSFDPFTERARTIASELSWRTPDPPGPAAGVALCWGALVLALPAIGRRLPTRHRPVAFASLLVAALFSLGALRVLAPLRYTDHVSEMDRLQQELRAAKAAGRPIAAPVPVLEPGILKAKYFFGDDFEIVPQHAFQAETGRPAGVHFLLYERGRAGGEVSTGASPAPPALGCDVRFLNAESLANPTQTSVAVSLIAGEEAEIFVEYGPAEAGWSHASARRIAAPEEPLVVTLDGLAPDREYRYRVRCRSPSAIDSGAEPSFGARAEHSFRTLRTSGSTLRFGFATDSHAYLGWTRAHCEGDASELAPLAATLENARASDLDFLILGGDEAQTHCMRCPACALDGESTGEGTVRSAREGLLRYRIMRRAFEPVSHSIPLFLALGNHDGEAGFASADGRCRYFEDTLALSRAARLALFPNPLETYAGGADGRYFAFASGDALFLILDVMGQTPRVPEQPEDWSLGAAQMRWLEQTLARSDRRWKLLFAHHLVGGSEMKLCYAYGRGGIKETQDGSATGKFRGEQARVHELMRRHGAQVFFYGHDHVFAVGEKRDPGDGGEPILYVAGGQAAGRETPSWTEQPAFISAYDFDGDGRPDYRLEKGFVRVTVEGERALAIEYVETQTDAGHGNGKVSFRRVLEGRRSPPQRE